MSVLLALVLSAPVADGCPGGKCPTGNAAVYGVLRPTGPPFVIQNRVPVSTQPRLLHFAAASRPVRVGLVYRVRERGLLFNRCR